MDIKTLLPELKKLVAELSEDLLKRVSENSEINAGLENAYKQIEKGGRTADAFEVWREDYLDQVAVAWVLGCVFVRFMEDNHLIDECWLAGEGEQFMEVAEVYRDDPAFDVTKLVAELVNEEHVPLLPVLRYKPSGLRKRAAWGKTWHLQRKEDAGEDVGNIPVPPKYSSSDFISTGGVKYWKLRGKLDVPKERWISFPHCETEADPSLVIGWAGWDHVQQATAIVAYYDVRKREGWTVERLTPLLACIDQLLPWIHQWHPEVDPEYNETAGTSFQTFLESEAQELGLTLEDIRNWTPPKKRTQPRKTRNTRKKKTTT